MYQDYKKICCCDCGIIFLVTKEFGELLVSSKRLFYCPRGHAQSYGGKTHEQKLRDKEKELQLERNFKNSAVAREKDVRKELAKEKRGRKKAEKEIKSANNILDKHNKEIKKK